MQTVMMFRGIRYQSQATILGRPLLAIATGPDFEKGEIRGHARGVIAIGDVATGWIAVGGAAFGSIFAFGGCAIGGIAFGGFALGLVALGGCAIGGLAIGGFALGDVAMGGAACGHYALGGGAWEKHVYSAMERSPEAREFFHRWLPALMLP